LDLTSLGLYPSLAGQGFRKENLKTEISKIKEGVHFRESELKEGK